MKQYLLEWIDIINSAYVSSKVIENEIHKASKEWVNVRDKAADFGSQVHEWVELFIKSKIDGAEQPELPSGSDEVKNGVLAFLRWYTDNNVEFLQTEKLVYSLEHQYVGTCDCIAKVNGKLSALDWKTSKGLYTSHLYQVVGYGIAYEEEMEVELEALYVIQFNKETGEFKDLLIDRRMYEELRGVFLACLLIANSEKKLKRMLK